MAKQSGSQFTLSFKIFGLHLNLVSQSASQTACHKTCFRRVPASRIFTGVYNHIRFYKSVNPLKISPLHLPFIHHWPSLFFFVWLGLIYRPTQTGFLASSFDHIMQWYSGSTWVDTVAVIYLIKNGSYLNTSSYLSTIVIL